MGKKQITYCDLTKQEIEDEDSLVIITIKKKGKTKGRSYDLSPDAAAKLEQQLVAGSDATLPEDWSFMSVPAARSARGRTLEDLENEPEDDAKFVAAKRRELREAGVIGDESPEEPTEAPVIDTTTSKCPTRHMNKGRIQTTMKNGNRFIYRLCADCRKRIPEKTAGQKESYQNQKPEEGVNVREL